MKKTLTIFTFLLGLIFISNTNIGIGAQMEQQTERITQVSASHILVKTQQEALDLKTKIENNEITFEDAAKQYSSCPSGSNGGALGYFRRGMMVKPFEDASFNGEIDKVSNPVQTQFGWHLIKVTDKK